MLWVLFLSLGKVSAQALKDTAGKIPINITNTKTFEALQTDSGALNKFIGDVQFVQGTDQLFCDSAYLNREKNSMEAFGNVRILQPNGTEVLSDYLRYSGNIRKAYLSGNVSLTNGKDHLWTEELDYDLATKIGNYYKGGTLQSGSTTVSSILGMYNASLKESRFIQEVYVTDTQYNIESRDLGYNTDTRMMRFFDTTVVYNTTSVLRTSKGTYDSKNEIARFVARSSILNDEHYIEGDTLDYNRPEGKGKALGNVVILDTAQHGTLFCGKAFYNDRYKTLLAIDKPVLKRVQNDDSIYIRADTFFSAHIRKAMRRDSLVSKPDSLRKTPASDTVKLSRKEKKKNRTRAAEQRVLTTVQAEPDILVREPDADTTSPKYYIGYHHVKIFSDSMQGKCDSISITMDDSVMRMMKDPVMWTRKSQLSGEVIIAYLDSGKVKKVFVPENAFMVSQSGPDQALLYNQVQGKTLTGNLVNNALTDAVVKPNAESIFYPTDEHEAYLGVSEAQSERMTAFFFDGKINKVLLEQEVKQTLTPMEQADLPGMKLSRFKWLSEQRPRSIAELFE